MKKLSIIYFCLVLGTIASCEPENIEENISIDSQLEQKSNLDPSCYTFQVKFNKYFYTFATEQIRLKATIYFGGFGPGLYLGTYTINEYQTVNIEIPERYRDSYQLSQGDRFKLEVDKISANGNQFFLDQLVVGQLGNNRKTYLDMGFRETVSGPFIFPYAGFDIRECE